MPAAARVGDPHTCPKVEPGPAPHVGGPIISKGSPDIEIDGIPAVCAGVDYCECKAGGPDPIDHGCKTVEFNGRLAVRETDMTLHKGAIAAGSQTVEIGVVGDSQQVAVESGVPGAEGAGKRGKDKDGKNKDANNNSSDEAKEKTGIATLIVHVRKENETGAPVVGVTVTVKGAEERTGTTDDRGDCVVENLKPGSYAVAARKELLIPDPTTTNVQVSSGTKEVSLILKCIVYELNSRRLIARAVGGTKASITNPFSDEGVTMLFGQDIKYGYGRKHPKGYSMGSSVTTLKSLMGGLIREYSSADATGMASRLLADFSKGHSSLGVFEDRGLNTAVEAHPNFKYFSEAVLGNFGTTLSTPGAITLHEALSRASWDIHKVTQLKDFVPCSFDKGSNSTNGLGVMIGDVTNALIYVERYRYDSCEEKYNITLRYVLYDSFGLDDDDVSEQSGYGFTGLLYPTAWNGLVAWWQLQHAFGYAPRITKIDITKEFSRSTKPPSPSASPQPQPAPAPTLPPV